MAKNLWFWARIFYSVPLFITGFIYLFRPQESVETLTSFIPGGLSLIYVAGGLWVILGFMLIFNIKIRFASLGVITLLGAYQMMVHIPAIYTGEYLSVAWFELLRDLSLMGGAFFILASTKLEETIEQNADDWGVSLY